MAAFEVLWDYLVKHRYVAEALDPTYPDYEGAELLATANEQLELARDLVQLSSAAVRSPRHAGDAIKVELEGHEEAVRDSLSKYLSAHLARRPEVRAFRAGLPDNGSLTSDEVAREFLVRHPQVQEALGQAASDFSTLQSLEELVRLAVSGASGRPHPTGAPGTPVYQEGHQEAAQRLVQLALWLSELYPFEPTGLVLLLLTGRQPMLSDPVQASVTPAHGKASIHYMPWVSSETINRVHAEVQRRVLGWHPGGPFRDKTFRAFQFVVEQTDEHGNRPPFSELLRLWNESHPSEKFEHESSLRRAYKRTAKKVAGPWP